jgi:hypothetical protein
MADLLEAHLLLNTLYINGVVVLVSSPWIPESSFGQLSRCKPGGQDRYKVVGDARSERSRRSKKRKSREISLTAQWQRYQLPG